MKYTTMYNVHPGQLFQVHNANDNRTSGRNTGHISPRYKNLSELELSLRMFSAYLNVDGNLGQFNYASSIFDTNSATGEVIKAEHRFLSNNEQGGFEITVSRGKVKIRFSDYKENEKGQTTHKYYDLTFGDSGAGLIVKMKLSEADFSPDSTVHERRKISEISHKLAPDADFWGEYNDITRRGIGKAGTFKAKEFFNTQLPKDLLKILETICTQTSICLGLANHPRIITQIMDAAKASLSRS